jgi:outer membrane protein
MHFKYSKKRIGKNRSFYTQKCQWYNQKNGMFKIGMKLCNALFYALLICSGLLMCSPAVYALDLIQAYERAEQTDPSWQAERLQYQSDQMNLGIASGNLLPTVTFSGSILRKSQDLNLNSTSSSGSRFISPTSTTRQIALTARQPLFRWDAWQGYKQVKTSVHLSEINLQIQEQQHVFNIAQIYFNVLRQQSLTRVNAQEEQALLKQLQMMQAKLKEGLVARSDVVEAQAQYENARANRIATGVQLLLAQEQLTQFIGEYREPLAVLSDDFNIQPNTVQHLEDWLSLAETHNLNVQQARLQQRFRSDAYHVEKAARYPQVDAVAMYGYNRQHPETLMSGDGQFDQIGVEMTWNVFTGGITKKSIQQAGINMQVADAQFDAVLRQAKTDIKSAYLQVETDEAKLSARKTARDSARWVAQASQAQYQEGLKNIVDLLLAQRNAFSAEQDYVNAQYDYVLNILKLKMAVGQLTQQDLHEMNQRLVLK